MAVKDIINAGIGFNPGSLAYVITRGLKMTTFIGGGFTYRYSDKKQREKREENEVLMFIKEFLRIQGRG